MTLKEAEGFVRATLTQQRLNREIYDDTETDNRRMPLDWGIICAEHMGHLLGALRTGNEQIIEQEILHVAAPLMECWNAIKTKVKEVDKYSCTRCGNTFKLGAATHGDGDFKCCPLCEATLERVS